MPEPDDKPRRAATEVPPPRGYVDGYVDGYGDGIRQTMIVFMTAMVGSLVLMRVLDRS